MLRLGGPGARGLLVRRISLVLLFVVLAPTPTLAETTGPLLSDAASRPRPERLPVPAEAGHSSPAAGQPDILVPQGEDSRPTDLSLVLKLNDVWKFRTDPASTGTLPENKWFAEKFDDSSWSDLRSGRPWESQGIHYSGYAWYRQLVALPASFGGKPLKLTLADINSDDEVFFDGVKIGGFKGEYKYKNILPRVYFIPPSLLRAGANNTIAIRIWGGRLGLQGAKSGLVAGQYTIEAVSAGLFVRDVGADPKQDRLLQLYDLSDAQRGHPFDLVFRFDVPPSPGNDRAFAYKLTDFYGDTLKSGETSLSTDANGITTGIVRIDPETSRKIYLAGRFKAIAIFKDRASDAVAAQSTFVADHLLFAKRDDLVLPPLPEAYDDTPYGKLKLVDEVDAGTPDDEEAHPYLQSAFGVHAQDFMTPGAGANVSVHTILGRTAREGNWSWFAYRVGRGKLVPGHTYLVRISYPEDKPRFAPVEIQTGQDYMDVGWKNGIAPDDVYDDWPLSHTWQDYDVVVPLGVDTLGSGGAGAGDGARGFWIYFMDQRKPGYYFSDYEGGAAVSTIKLYEIDPKANEPHLTLPPRGLPRRTMTFDWERQPTSPPADMVAYARLMGYSAVSPTILKWGFTNFAAPVQGFTSANVDAAHYWETSPEGTQGGSTPTTGSPPKSVHEQYLDATRESGVDYMPRIEYGGSNVLPVWARSIGADGRIAKPDRFASWGADLLSPATFTDFQAYLDSLVRPYVASNPQFKGVVWRVRQDRLQISYSREDIARFARESSISPPDHLEKLTPTEAAEWANTPPVAPLYVAWWEKQRADFHQKVARMLKDYRSDMTLLYFNWDQDKFSLLQPDRLSAAFASKIQSVGGPAAYAEDRQQRRSHSPEDYITPLLTGQFSGSLPQLARPGPWPDYALLPSLYANIDGIQLLAPVPGLPYANMPNYINYFRTTDGLAVSHIVSYDELGARELNPKFEGAMVLPGGAPFSMSVELLAYFYGDVRTLTYTAYTYGRGYADAHRRFAQAFRALPAVPGQLVSGTPADIAARLYPTSAGTYLGIAHKGYRPGSFMIDVPGKWSKTMKVTNLVTGETRPIEMLGDKLHLELTARAMELDAFRIE